MVSLPGGSQEERVPEQETRESLWDGREAPPGFEPGVEVLQTSALPLGYGAGTQEDPAGPQYSPDSRPRNNPGAVSRAPDPGSARGYPDDATKQIGEVALVAEPGGQRDLGERQVGVGQPATRELHPDPAHVRPDRERPCRLRPVELARRLARSYHEQV